MIQVGKTLLLPDGVWAQSGSTLSLPVVCGFFNVCRKGCTTQVQVILRVYLLKWEGL